MFRFVLPIVAALAILAPLAPAQPLTTAFTFQGNLQSAGTPVTGVYDAQFRLFDAASAGNQIGATLCVDNLAIAAGSFTAQLDFGSQFAGQQRYLEISIRQDTGLSCANATGFTALSPRQPLTASPNAIFALTAGGATSATQLNGQPASFYQNAANLTSGVIPSPRLAGIYSAALTLSNVSNSFMGSFTGSGAGLTGLSAANISTGTLDIARLPVPFSLTSSAPAGAISAETTSADSAAAAIFAHASNASGSGSAIVGQSDSPSGLAAFFSAPNVGVVCSTTADDAFRSYTSGSGKSAIAAFHTTSASGYALYGQVSGSGGAGVYGRATSSSGTASGILGQSSSTGAYGVWGQAPSIACRGETSATSGFAVGLEGLSYNNASGYGVWAEGQYGVYGNGTVYGVWGQCDLGTGYGLYANGRTGATGTKSFRIDHPADPENKYLLHYTTESPEVLNAYSGHVILDARGQATVALPSYFAAINTDPRYTLTAVGAAMPMLHIDQEIDPAALEQGNKIEPGQPIPPCSFRIAGGAPNAKVCWRVEAVRNDRWLRRYGAPVEQDKPASERGTYQDPDLYGQPKEKALGYHAESPTREPSTPAAPAAGR